MQNVNAIRRNAAKSQGFRAARPYLPSVISIVALLVIGQILAPGFVSMNNINNIITVSSFLAMVAVAQNFVIISGSSGIDLSVGAMVSLGALIGPSLTEGMNEKIILGVLILAGMGAVVGFINGIGTRVLKINSLVMTLVMERVINGFIYAYTRGQPSFSVPPALLDVGKPLLGPIRIVTAIAFIVIIAMGFVLHRSKYGKSVFLYGSNPVAARLSGLKTTQIGVSVYMLSSILACLTGFLLVGYVGSSQLKMGHDYTLMSVASVVIGGTQLAGGKGSILGSTLGAVVLTLLTNILTAVGLNDGVKQLIQGLVLVGILIINEKLLSSSRNN